MDLIGYGTKGRDTRYYYKSGPHSLVNTVS